MPFKDKILIIEIFYLLGGIRFLILYRKFKNNLFLFGEEGKESARGDLEKEDYVYARKISRLVRTISKLTPWKSACLVKALTIMRLLKKKNLKSTIYLGVSNKKGISAHAWLRCGEFIVSGGEEMKNYKQIAFYSFD